MPVEFKAHASTLIVGEGNRAVEKAPFVRPRVAIVPCAGRASRFMPAAKVTAKELLPVLDTPILQLVYQEIRSAGIDEIVFVINEDKDSIRRQFEPVSLGMAQALLEGGKEDLLAELNAIGEGVKLSFIYQSTDKRGNGIPVLDAFDAGLLYPGEPFVVIWGDEIINAKPRTRLQQMMEVYERMGGAVISAVEIPEMQRHKYGMAKLIEVPGEPHVREILEIREKPPRGKEPSPYAAHGAYILDWQVVAAIREAKPTIGGEVFLMQGINALRELHIPVYAALIEGADYCDMGSIEGYVITNLKGALAHPAIGRPVAEFMADSALSFMPPALRTEYAAIMLRNLMKDTETVRALLAEPATLRTLLEDPVLAAAFREALTDTGFAVN